MQISQVLNTLAAGNDLDVATMESIIDELMSGSLTSAQTGALLMGLRCKGEAVSEIAAAARIMRRHATPIDPGEGMVVDTCGTGGDGSGTFNISTTAAFIAAGAGVKIAKHGNRAASSRSGSADVLESLGVNVKASPETVGACVREVGIGFLFAQTLHGAMKHVIGARREMGIRTMFNLLGPLTNPAGAHAQVIGVFAPELTEVIAGVLRDLGCEQALVVHGYDRLDEITLTANTKVTELRNGELKTWDLDPRNWFHAYCQPEDLAGGEPDENAAITRDVLNGAPGPKANVAIANAAAAIYVSGIVGHLDEAVEKARESIASGAAAEKLAQLVERSNA
jgi:anthranilate phosphoribosyltransferase